MTPTSVEPDAGAAARGVGRAGLALGFALGGFFDGILLHQILQWHHLLSAVEGPAFRDVRVQILADGLFHLLMYAIAILGLWLLWRGRGAFARAGADRRLLADALIGFGAWHALDAVLSHWILGIHRIRMDVAQPLLWDVGWLVVFGLSAIAAGWLLRRRGGGTGGRAAPAALTLAVLVAGPIAALPPPNVSTVMVLFRPGTSEAAMFEAIDAVDGRAVWHDPSGQLWAVDVGPKGNAGRLYLHGALLVGNGLLPVACFNWSRA